MNFIEFSRKYSQTMPEKAPPIAVAHPDYGLLGSCDARKGFIPTKGRWTSSNAIARDHSRRVIKALRKMEDKAPKYVMAAIAAALMKNPMNLPWILGAISTYDGIVAARGANNMQDVFMSLTATIGGVTTSWYDLWKGSWTPGSSITVANYVHAGTGGAVLDSASSGSWLANTTGANKKYIISCGVTVASITGFTYGILMDNLWGGEYAVTSNTTLNPTTDVAVTRYTGTDSAGNMIMTVMASTLTHTGAATITTTYTDQSGTTGKTTASVLPATGVLIHRVILNTFQASATVNWASPYHPLYNAGSSGVRSLEQIDIAGGTVTVGTVNTKIARPLIIMPFIAANTFVEQDVTLNIGNMVELKTVTNVCGCLSWAVFTGGSSATNMSAFIRTVEG